MSEIFSIEELTKMVKALKWMISCEDTDRDCGGEEPDPPDRVRSRCFTCQTMKLTIERNQARQNLGNILAVIFNDGGHRQAEIGDDKKAVEEAHQIWAKLVLRAEEADDYARQIRETNERRAT